MTGRDRMLAVFEGRKPDRVPVTLFIVDQGHFLNQCFPDTEATDFRALQLQQIELQRKFGCDLLIRLLFDVNDPLHTAGGGLDVTTNTDNWVVENTEYKNGNTTITHSRISTPDGVLEQESSVYELRPGTLMYGITKKAIKSEKDLDIAIRYEPKMRAENFAAVKEKISFVKEAVGDDGITGVWAPPPPFNNAAGLVEDEEIYSVFLTDEAFYAKLMNFCIERASSYTEAILAAEPDVLHIGGNVAGGFIGRRNYENYILPYERRYIEYCQHTGIPAIYHNCGEVMNLVESYKGLGVKAVEPFSPAPLGDAELDRVCEIVGDAFVILAGVDQVNILQKGTPEQVKAATRKTVETGKNSGCGFIIQSADLLEYGTPFENIEAFVETAKEYGVY